MVNSSQLDSVFHALADSTRRSILEQLTDGTSKVADLAKPHSMSAPAISKHLRVLEDAGLIEREKRGREHHIQADPAPLEEVRDWISVYADHWHQRFDALDEFLAKQSKKKS